MFIKRKNFMRSALLGTAATFLAGSMGVGSQAFAQDQDAADDEDAELVIVTGSRIARSSLTSPQPLAVIGNQAIQVSGLDNLAEIFNELPFAGVPGISSNNSNFSVSASGLNIINLRNIGSSRTLVLLDGRRAVSGRPGISAVDMNTIPVDFIERVEIVTGGAAALYGSDAVAGVVNVIFKDDFEGIRFRAQGSITTEGGGDDFSLAVTTGGNFDNGRGNAVVNVSYNMDFGLKSVDRANQFFTDLDHFLEFTTFGPSTFIPGGRFLVGDGVDGCSGGFFAIDAQGNAPCFFEGTTAQDLGFNRQAFRRFSTPTERILLAAKGHYDITDGLTFFADTQFADVTTFAETEPFAFSATGIFPATFMGVPLDNPFIPASLQAEIDGVNLNVDGSGNLITTDDITSLFFVRRMVEIGARTASNDRTTMRISVGLRGDFSNTWNWDTSYTFGKSTQFQAGTGQINTASFRLALDAEAVLDPSGNPIPGLFQCKDPDSRAQGCVPINVFGAGSITPQAAAWINAGQSLRSEAVQQVLAANLAGTVFQLPAGAVSIATGIEHRRESSDFNPDALSQAGLNAGNISPRTTGSFNVSEWYFEGDIPLFSDSGLGDYAGIGGVVRIADYSTVGTVISWNVRGEWQPISDIRFRVNYGQSVRAPNISELFTAPAQTFPPGLSDPCAGVTISSTGTLPITANGGGGLASNCLMEPGILAQIASTGSFIVGFQQIQGISGFNRGNENLNEESADTLTISAILTPQFAPGLSITIDYYDIDISDAIQGIARQDIIDGCYNNPVGQRESFCEFIERWAGGTPNPIPGEGQLKFVDQSQLNVGALETSGIDVNVDYTTPVDSLFSGADGTLSFNLIYSYLISFSQSTILPAGTVTADNRDTVYVPIHRANAQITYDNGPMQVAYSVRMLGASSIFGGPDDPDDEFDYLDMEVYHDIQVRYRFGNAEVYAGINNIFANFGKAIPPAYGPPIGQHCFCDFYDAFGRVIQAGVILTY